MRRYFLLCLVLIACVAPVFAHANFERSDPAPNARLDAAPQHIRLWFTEPLEPRFSHARVLDATGAEQVITQTVATDDAYQLVLEPEALPAGLYTVTWRVVSATDGHASEGNLVFAVGMAAPVSETNVTSSASSSLTPENVLLRAFNFVSMAWLVGVLGFSVFIWHASGYDAPPVDQILRRQMAFGWLLVGVASLAIFALQAALFAGVPLHAGLSGTALAATLETRFGIIWLLRMGIWAGIGAWLRFGRLPLPALILATLLLLTTSLHSHADEPAAIVVDWLHLLATTLWLGALVAFASVVPAVRRHFAEPLPVLARLVAYFSNLGRVAVFALSITGAWLAIQRVGSIEALFQTTYGNLLLIKLGLFVPLLGVAAINLFLTAHGLRAGKPIWAGRLRQLILLEMTLGAGILLAVGGLTSVSPAANTPQPSPTETAPAPITPLMDMQMSDDLHAHLSIIPGTLGENTFSVTLYDANGNPINDATRIRLRFENKAQNTGRSELRPTLVGDGEYSISGTNISLAGTWQIRMTVQRPDQFDSVLDFTFEIPAPE